jgi:undecaprenyl-phosphate galactose phosphotransferase
MLIFAVLIKLSSKGPVFVSNTLRFSNFKPFFMYKFRTMHMKADEEVLELYPELKYMLDSDHKIPVDMDPRVTRLGKFLRKSDLDELPQVINVLIGNMSLVGPRPYMKWEVEKVLKGDDPIAKDNIREIQKIKPGITGLWQISGRNSVKFTQRLELDAIYCRNRSMLLDLKILFKTPKILITGKGRL